MRRALLVLLCGLAACAPDGSAADGDDVAEAGALDGALLRDFTGDGKFDEAGHPLNARVTEAEAVCRGRGKRWTRVFEIDARRDGAGEVCRGPLDGGEQRGELTLSARLWASDFRAGRDIATVEVWEGDHLLGISTLRPTAVRAQRRWMHLAVPVDHEGDAPLSVRVVGAGNGRLVLDSFELFPSDFRLVVAPGSGEVTDRDQLTFEAALGADITLDGNGVDLSDQLAALERSGRATVERTSYRRLVKVAVGDLLKGLTGDVELAARTDGGDAARVQLRRAAPPCRWEGDPSGRRVLVTGFQPFPADARHENVSGVAVRALRPSALRGAQVMRMVMPVEYDRAAAQVASAIARCAPDVVVSFGQGAASIALEHTAWNLKDTSEVPGGVPDNRGAIAAVLPIDPDGEESRPATLPLDTIDAALRALGERPVPSDDPGRYICNNVFYVAAGAAPRAGFVHLPYTTVFTDAVRARYGAVVEAVVNATVR